MTDKEKLEKIIELVTNFGPFDGSHHKDWVLQEVLEVVQGKELTDDDLRVLGWERGVAP